jgi:hypothetical protein
MHNLVGGGLELRLDLGWTWMLLLFAVPSQGCNHWIYLQLLVDLAMALLISKPWPNSVLLLRLLAFSQLLTFLLLLQWQRCAGRLA